MQPKKYSYYTIDTGFYQAPVKLCFSVESFDEIIRDHKIQTKEQALTIGVAECHYFTDNKTGLIILVFDMEELESDEDASNVYSTLVHESCHCVRRIFEYIGAEDVDEETQAYLTEYIFKQVLKGWTTERDKRVRKSNREALKLARKTSRRPVVQVGLEHFGSAGQAGLSEQTNLSSGTKDSDGRVIS